GERGPGAEARESHGATSDNLDWYNDFQSSESDDVDFCNTKERPSLLLASLYGPAAEEKSAGSSTDLSEGYAGDGERKGSYYPYGDHQEYYGEQDQSERQTDTDLRLEDTEVGSRSGSEVDQKENPALEVEEALHWDSPSDMDTVLVDSECEEPPVPKVPPKAPPRRLRSRTSRRPKGACEGVLSSEEDTPSAKDRSPRAQAPKPKPRKGKKAVSPVPAPETGQSAKASPEARAPKPEQPPPHTSAKRDPVRPGRTPTQRKIGGLAGAPAAFPGLISSHLCNPVVVPVRITGSCCSVSLHASACSCQYVCACVCCYPSPGVSPALLLALARGRLPGPLVSLFGISLGLGWCTGSRALEGRGSVTLRPLSPNVCHCHGDPLHADTTCLKNGTPPTNSLLLY
ncbi:hypothetical protein P4O66_021157, partial [Electrophorus voltai]